MAAPQNQLTLVFVDEIDGILDGAGEPLCCFSAIIGPEARQFSWQRLKIN